MGYRSRWMAVKKGNLALLLQAVGLRIESESLGPVYDPGHYAVNLPDGWLVVIGDGWDALETVQPAHARALSAGTEALHFYSDDTPMCASLRAYRDGREVWSLEHDGSIRPHATTVKGTPPSLVAEVMARLREKQEESGNDDVDYLYEAAPETALALVGFRHDRTLAESRERIFVLSRG
jgi:hypothetical protein